MTSNLQDLIDSTFYMMYYLKISPSEVDGLYTYEMRQYLSMLMEKIKDEHESDSSLFKSLVTLFGLRKKSKS